MSRKSHEQFLAQLRKKLTFPGFELEKDNLLSRSIELTWHFLGDSGLDLWEVPLMPVPFRFLSWVELPLL